MDIIKEKEYLKRTIDVITENVHDLEVSAEKFGDDLLKRRAEIWDSTYEIDETEQSTLETGAQLEGDAYLNTYLRKNVLERQSNSPYWGRVNYTPNGMANEDLYIGL